MVKINNAAWNQSCEREVNITSDVVKLDGCNETGISLFFDPNDQEYPCLLDIRLYCSQTF